MSKKNFSERAIFTISAYSFQAVYNFRQVSLLSTIHIDSFFTHYFTVDNLHPQDVLVVDKTRKTIAHQRII